MPKHAPRGPIKGKPLVSSDPMNRPGVELERCTATNRQGQRCKRWPIRGGNVCTNHGGGAPQVKRKAAERLAELVPKAIGKLDALMDRDEYPSVQFAASKAVIEFSEGKATERIEQEHSGGLVISWQTSES